MDPNKKYQFVVGVTGASGSLYGRAFLRALARNVSGQTRLIVSPAAIRVYNAEYDTNLDSVRDYLDEVLSDIKTSNHEFILEDYKDIGARPASGSYIHDGMVIVPCSMKSLAGIAHGYSSTLVERAADVCLKERHKLILMPRETPYSLVHLKNMTALTEAGATILPASPGFYQKPATISELGEFMAGRVFALLGIRHALYPDYDPGQTTRGHV